MTKRLMVLVLVSLAVAGTGMAETRISRVPEPAQAARIRAHIEFLASPDRQGRTGRGKYESARYIVDWFESHGLEPFFGDQFVQDVPDLGDDEGESGVVGQNLGAWVIGSDPQLCSEVIVVNAHYDHLGMRHGLVYPGADDNASGVAMLLELAAEFATSRPRRSIAFVAFDLEEYLLWGSRWFMAHPPIELDQIKLCLTADMIGRSLGGLGGSAVFVMGAEHSPQLHSLLREIDVPLGLELAELGTDIVGTRSDYGPFRDRHIPFLFFSTGEHPDYHRPTDVPQKVNINKVSRVTRVVSQIVMESASQSEAPQWVEPLESTYMAEVDTIHRVTRELLNADQNGQQKLSDLQRFFISQVHSKTAFLQRQQRMTPAERRWLVRATQILMLSTF